jgi:hypothetical protein
MEAMKIKYALIGGGYVLNQLATILDPQEFVITSRSPDNVNTWKQAGWNAQLFDYAKPDTLENFFESYSNLHVWLDSVPPFAELRESITCFKSLALAYNMPRVLYLSTTGVYGVTDGSWVDETTKLNPAHMRSANRVLAEELYQSDAYNFSALRISGIYGPGRGTGLALQRGVYPFVEDGEFWSNRIQVVDLANIIKQFLEYDLQLCLPAAINLTDDSPSLTKDVVKFYCQKFNFTMPTSITKEQAQQSGMYTITGNQRVSNALLHKLISYQFKYPSYVEGAGTEFVAEA